MRFHTAISAQRRSLPEVNILRFPNPEADPEIHIAFGGLSVWLSRAEAAYLVDQLHKAGAELASTQ